MAKLRLVIRDPAARVVLWTIDEKIDTAARQSTGRKNFDKAMSALIEDLQKLTAPDSSPK